MQLTRDMFADFVIIRTQQNNEHFAVVAVNCKDEIVQQYQTGLLFDDAVEVQAAVRKVYNIESEE